MSTTEQLPVTVSEDDRVVIKETRSKQRRVPLGELVSLAPATLIYTFLLVGPAIVALALSFFSWNGIGAFKWVGLGEWSRFFRDSGVWYALWLTIQVTVISWFVQTLSRWRSA